MSEGIENIEVIKPKQRIINIVGITVDSEQISFDLCLDIVSKMEEMYAEKGTTTTKKLLKFFGGLIDKIIKEQNSQITDEWLSENINGVRRFKLLSQIILPLINELIESDETESKSNKKKSNSI